ncbi:MAG: hypothetical protein M0Z38_11545 [Deltaproteobacteria bacterium]|nr:hypothetical protein [Deltaproteobacteria bacterium]
MSRRRILSLGALLAILGGIGLLAAVSTMEQGPHDAVWKAVERPDGPELILREVEVREIREGEPQSRLTSDRVSYLLNARRLSAAGVTLFLPGISNGIVVRAPKASWDMEAGTILLDEGGAAGNAAGWSAIVAAASLSLPNREMSAAGNVRLSGPGLQVAGDNMVWGWREGKLALSNTRTRVESPRALRGMR